MGARNPESLHLAFFLVELELEKFDFFFRQRDQLFAVSAASSSMHAGRSAGEETRMMERVDKQF